MQLGCRYSTRFLAGLAFALVLAGSSLAQVEIWASRYDGYDMGDDAATATALMSDGNIVVTGYSQGSDFTYDVATMMVSAETGETLWLRRYSDETRSRDEAWYVAVDDSDNIFVTGKTMDTLGNVDYLTIKYLVDGTLVWVQTHNNFGTDSATGVVADQMGGCFVTGASQGTSGMNYVTFHYGADGTKLWGHRLVFPGGGHDFPTDLVLDDSGHLYITGYARSVSGNYDYMTVKYDTATAETLWTRSYDGTASGVTEDDYAYAIATDDSGNVYVTGRAGETGTWYDATTVKYGSDGTRRWVHRIDKGESSTDGANEIAVGSNGYVYCAGATETSVGYLDLFVYSIRPDGNTNWVKVYNYLDDDSATAMVLDEQNNVYVAVYSDGYEGDFDWITFKYSASGSEKWSVRHSVYDEDDFPYSINVDRLGNVYVAGYDVDLGSQDMAMLKYSEYDVGAAVIVQPVDTFRLGAVVQPRVWVRNYSAIELTFPVRLEIGGFYFDAQNASNLAPYDSVLMEFAPWRVRDVGTFGVKCFSMLTGDREPENDTASGTVSGVYAWEQLPSIPQGPRDREVKDGGDLAYVPDSLVFAFKGNNTTEFYKYNILTEEWTELESIPAYGSTGRKRRVKKGARLEPVGKHIYAMKGNNTYEFWRYSLEGDTGWVEKSSYPMGASGKKVKGGTGLEYVESRGWLLSSKGSNTFEFYGYDVAADSWFKLADVPPGDRRKKVKYGSCIAYDGDNTVFLLKGSSYEFWAYGIAQDTWWRKPDLRPSLLGGRKRKVKKGAFLAYDPEFERVYASKGGKSTEFWYFDIAQDSWVETTDTIPLGPSGKAPYYGGCGEYADGKIYSLKGNKTLEFYRFHANFPIEVDGGGGAQTSVLLPRYSLRLAASPNPFRHRAVISYALPRAGRVRLALFDVTGRTQQVLVDDWQAVGDHHVPVRGQELSAGIYLASLTLFGEGEPMTAARKLLVTR